VELQLFHPTPAETAADLVLVADLALVVEAVPVVGKNVL